MTPEIPLEGDLIRLPEPTKAALQTLSNQVRNIAGEGLDAHKKLLDAAIGSGRRAEVTRALQYLQSRSEFHVINKEIEEMRANVAHIDDQIVQTGEQASRWTYQNLVPSWARLPVLGAVAGGAVSLTLLPVQWITRMFSKEKAAAIGKFRAGAFTWGAGIGLAAGIGKAGLDVYRQGTAAAILPERLRQSVSSTDLPTIDMGERTKRVRDHLNNIEFQRPLTTNNIFIPAIDTTKIPVTEIIIRQFAANQTTPLQIDAVALPVATGGRTIAANPNAARLEVEYKVQGVTTQISPIVKEKSANP